LEEAGQWQKWLIISALPKRALIPEDSKDPFSAIKMLCFFIADSGVEFHAFYLSFHAAWFHNLSSTDSHIDS
jgi:hypothetical protein